MQPVLAFEGKTQLSEALVGKNTDFLICCLQHFAIAFFKLASRTRHFGSFDRWLRVKIHAKNLFAKNNFFRGGLVFLVIWQFWGV